MHVAVKGLWHMWQHQATIARTNGSYERAAVQCKLRTTENNKPGKWMLEAFRDTEEGAYTECIHLAVGCNEVKTSTPGSLLRLLM